MANPAAAWARGFASTKDGANTFASFSDKVTSAIWLLASVTSLVLLWCLFDSWNHDMSSHLFTMSEVKSMTNAGGTENIREPFHYTLTLAFLQFAFMGVVFSAMFAVQQASRGKTIEDAVAEIKPTISDCRWPSLVTSHVCGSVLMQSLMMPTQMMSLGVFAASRAVEIPVSAGVRASVLGPRFVGPSMKTTMMMFAAAWLLFFSYTQIAECMCIWSGFGVALSGMALYIVYAFLLTVPATNTVLQEAVMMQLNVSPLAMLAIQNVCAAVVFLPILFAAQCTGKENVTHALCMIFSHKEVYMLVLWMCVQLAAISSVTVALIMLTDSFWAVSARSLRVVFWWSRQLAVFYMSSNTMLSVARPHAALWSMVMVSGIAIALAAVATDHREAGEDKKSLLPLGKAGRYV